MEKIDNKIFLDWVDIHSLVDKLCNQIEKLGVLENIKSIMGLPRGGLIPAVIISHKLNIPLITSIPNYFELTPEFIKETLIIDDICDSGETLTELNNKIPNIFPQFITGVLHYKPHTSCISPHYYAEIHKGDEWIVYPWENINSKAIQDYKRENIYKQI